ncbi:Uncharacterized conserved protein [Microbulbifer donghaiensis]|uniref:Uncharacterized conserved protein n=2 Tax=Microbulbifer donghaiensis TaxID=494016 RepID=A0A1M4UZ68_9GAMM|nr:Uncharacterized conserved protein [Microbulbifer donghaiensis]
MHRSVNLKLCLFALAASLNISLSYAAEPATGTADDALTVYKHRLCFCCKRWIEHLNANGLQAQVAYRGNMSKVKEQWGLPEGMTSCHTAVWHGKYVFEGHVPARLINKFLADPPEGSFGLTVPGMPDGSPGMYRGGEFEPYNVYLLLSGGDYRFYTRIEKPEDD